MIGAETNKVPSFALTQNGNTLAHTLLEHEPKGTAMLTISVSELHHVGFAVFHREPNMEYAVSIGDSSLPPGQAFGPNYYWADGHYFESARGRIVANLRSSVLGSGAPWPVRAHLDVNVVPTKLGEQSYEILLSDIQRTAAGLIFDIVSKVFRGVRYARGLTRIATRSNNLEFANLRILWNDLSRPLELIVSDPHLRVGRFIQLRSYDGTGVLTPNIATRLATRGIDPRSQTFSRPVTIPGEVLMRTGDTVEHRTILWFLKLLLQRARECIESAREQISIIQRDQEFRDIRFDNGPTLYEEIDLPKIQRLRDCIEQGRLLTDQIRRASQSTLFRGVQPQEGITDTPVFRHVDSYYRFGLLMLRYLSTSLIVLDTGDGERLKATSRLYEQWVFLRLAEAFRSCGLLGGDIEGVVRRLTRHRFVLDLDDEVVLVFHVGRDRRIRLRYEPWIPSKTAAIRRGESLYRGVEGPVPPWRPDVLVEFISGDDVIYAVVVDSKYTKRIFAHRWSGVEKYTQIRTVTQLRQVVRQVWIAYPGESAQIRCRDTSVTWTDSGPDRPHDEIIMGELELCPVSGGTEIDESEDPSSVAHEFVLGLMRYVGFAASL